MKLNRRHFIAASASGLAAPMLSRPAIAAIAGAPLPIPDILEPGSGGDMLEAIPGNAAILDGAETRTFGYSQAHMGPTLRLTRGRPAKVTLKNRLPFAVTGHWHGAHIDAAFDGGPQTAIATGEAREVDLTLDQPATTLWYHSHTHGITAEQVYGGLSGLIIVDDPGAAEPLPNRYGIDDLPLIIQDRAFQDDGFLAYSKAGMFTMHGFRGDRVMVNGAIAPQAAVPQGLVRLRLLNGSNARFYDLRFSDGRSFHQIGTDGGLLPAPYERQQYYLLPAERIEILVDFSDGTPVSLVSGPDPTAPGMMGGTPPPQSQRGARGTFDIVDFRPDAAIPGNGLALPESFASAPAEPTAEPVRRREIRLDMNGPGGFGINGKPYAMDRIDLRLNAGETELWHVTAPMMVHPFHIHACSFRVVSRKGEPVPWHLSGMKDVALINGETELLVQVNNRGTDDLPFMYHCHVLEHEDAGMMGQFTCG